jgi:hypothetical protein
MPARDQGILRTRIPDELLEQLQEAATANRRSMAAEVAYRLERSFAEPGLIEAFRVELAAALKPMEQELRALRYQADMQLTKGRKS